MDSAPDPSCGSELQLVLFTGMQGAGKSSFYRMHFAQTHLHVSKDLWPSARRPQRRQMRVIEEALRERRCVVVDNTNPHTADRAPLIALGQRYGATLIGYFFPAPLDECLERNSQRCGRARVPDVALFVTAGRLEPPSLAEGFARLYAVCIQGDGFRVQPWTGM